MDHGPSFHYRILEELPTWPAYGCEEILSQFLHTSLQLTLVFGTIEVALR